MSTDIDNLAGPELARAALEAVGWRVKTQDELVWIIRADGSSAACGNTEEFAWKVFSRFGPEKPWEDIGDAVALLEEWAGDVYETHRHWSVEKRHWSWAEERKSTKTRRPYLCRMEWPGPTKKIQAWGSTLCEAICRALIEWDRSRDHDESLTTAGEGGRG